VQNSPVAEQLGVLHEAVHAVSGNLYR